MIDPSYWGQGYGQEAVKQALDVAFETLQKTVVMAMVHPDNLASQCLVSDLGAVLQGDVTMANSPFNLYHFNTPESAI